MIYLFFAHSIDLDGNTIPVGGHFSRIVAVSQFIDDDFSILPIDAIVPKYQDGDMIIIDAGNNEYEHLLSDKIYSVLLSDDYGLRYDGYGVDLVIFVSGGAADYSFGSDYVGHNMYYTVSQDIKENSWVGGDRVLFVPGGNKELFWEKARKFKVLCEENDIPHIIVSDMPHNVFIAISKYARCVITAAGVTSKEMVYQGVPTILINTAENQNRNYSYFTQDLMAFPETVNPDVLNDLFALDLINKRIIRNSYKKLNTKHMIETIRKYYETNR